MPPRKSSSPVGPRPSKARRPSPPQEEQDEVSSASQVEDPADMEWEAPPGRMSREVRARPVSDEEPLHSDDEGTPVLGPDEDDAPSLDDDPLPSFDDDELPSSTDARDRRELYGEDDEPEEDDAPARPAAARAKAAETRIAPAVQLDDDEDALPEGEDAVIPPYRFEITAGPDKGKVLTFRGVRLVVGRTEGCNVILEDGSVSRRHLELVAGEKGVLLRDLGSGNGTKVNGERVAEVMLAHGAVIALGKTRLRFVDEAKEAEEAKKNAPVKSQHETRMAAVADIEAAHAEEEGAPTEGEASDGAEPESVPEAPVAARGLTFTQKIVAGLAVIVLLLAVAGAISFLRKPGPPPQSPRQTKALAKLAEAKQAFDHGEYEKALGSLDAAEFILPGVDPGGGLREAVKADLAGSETLARCKLALSESRFEDLDRELAALPKTSERLAAEFAALAKEAEPKRLEWQLASFGAAIEARDADRAHAFFKQLPTAKMELLRPTLVKFEQQLADEEAAAQKQQAVQRRVSAQRSKERREAEIVEALEPVAKKLAARDYERAIRECDRVVEQHKGDAEIRTRALAAKKQLPIFQRNFEDGERKFAAGALESSVRPLEKARETLAAMKLGSALGQTVDEHLSAGYLNRAKQALAKDEVLRAQIIYQDVLRMRPDDPGALAGLDKIVQRAERLIIEAYVVRDRDPQAAAAKLRTVLQITPAKSPTYKKAEQDLKTLSL